MKIHHDKILLLTLLSLFLFQVSELCAKIPTVEFTSTVNATRISINDKLLFSVSITGPHYYKDRTLISHRGYSKDFDIKLISTMVKWHSSVKFTRCETFIFMPRKTGQLEVGKVNSGLRNSSTAPFHTITVVDGPPLLENTSHESHHNFDWGGEIFIDVTTDKQEYYVGEQVLYTLRQFDTITNYKNIHTQCSRSSIGGFLSINLPRSSDKVLLNYNYRWSENHNFALFPNMVGNHLLGQMSLHYSATRGSASQWGSLEAPPISVTIKPLPEKGRPDDFFGAVGNFSIYASIRQTYAMANEEIVLTVTVKGTGNTGAITSPVEPDLSSFKSYSLKIDEDVTKDRQFVGGTKTWSYSFLPKKHGQITIQPFRLSYFNPKDHRYHTVSTEPIIVNVMENNRVATKKNPDTRQQSAIQSIASDIRFIKPDKKTLKSEEAAVHSSGYFYLVYTLSFAFFLISISVKKRRDSLLFNPSAKRQNLALKRARQRLAEASDILDQGDIKGFYGKIHNCVMTYIEDKLTIQKRVLKLDSLIIILQQRGITQTDAEKIRNIFELCDFAEYSPGGLQLSDHTSVVRNVSILLSDIHGRMES